MTTTEERESLYDLQESGNSVSHRNQIFEIINEGDPTPGFEEPAIAFKGTSMRWRPGIDAAVRFTPDGIVTVAEDTRYYALRREALRDRLVRLRADGKIDDFYTPIEPATQWRVYEHNVYPYHFKADDDVLEKWLTNKGY